MVSRRGRGVVRRMFLRKCGIGETGLQAADRDGRGEEGEFRMVRG